MRFIIWFTICLVFNALILKRINCYSQNHTGCPGHCVCYRQSIVCRGYSDSRLPHIPPNIEGADGGVLQYFSMSQSKLNTLQHRAITDLIDLISIDLSNNEISLIEDGALKNLPSLNELFLRYNRISSIPSGMLEGLINLHELDLSFNQMINVPISLERLVNIRVLGLQGNPIHCPCELLDFALLLPKLEEPGRNVLCRQPAEVEGQKLVDIGRKYVSTFNGTRHLGYDSDKSRTATPSLQKSRSNVPWPLTHCRRGEHGGKQPASLVIEHIDSSPIFTKTPSAIIIAEGERAFFICEAKGWPTPKISWKIPSNESSFIRLWNRRSILEIREVHAYHAGSYMCIAENRIGQVRYSVSLEIADIVKPQIVAAPAAQKIGGMVGGDLELVCAARGRPRPTISWLWRRTTSEQRLSTEGRYILRASSVMNAKSLEDTISEKGDTEKFIFEGEEDSVTLTIRNVTEEDVEGRYICYAANRAGSARVSSVISLSKPMGPRIESHDNLFDELPASNEEIYMNSTLSSNDSNEDLVRRIIEKARKRIDAVIQKTAENLRDPSNRKSVSNIASLFRQPSKAAVELAKAAEVYEAALDEVTQLFQKQRQQNLGKEEQNIYRGDEDFDEQKRSAMGVQLSAEQLAIIAQLSGCAQSQRMEPCDKQLCFHLVYRSIDGGCNNLNFPRWGAALSPFYRLLPPVYENGVNTPVGWSPERLYFGFPKPSARLVSYQLLADATKLEMHTRRLRKFNEKVKVMALSNVTSMRMLNPFEMPIEIVNEEELFDEDDKSSGMLMQWGQFLDHDLDFTPVDASTSRFSDGLGCNETCINDSPCFPILVPPGDPRIRQRCIGFARSSATCGSGSTSILLGRPQYREQLNQITAFIDASNVYGSDEFEGNQLRYTLHDEGYLREGMPTPSGKKLLPFNIRGQVDCQADPGQDFVPCFKAGDHRNNENLGLITMHTIWMREHNRIADGLRALNPHWSGDRIFQESRKIVGACMQSITYRAWLPQILGPEGMRLLGADYPGYDISVNPTISNEFATAAFRFGHTLVSPFIFRLNERWRPIEEGHLLLHQAFFAPDRMLKDGGMDPIIRGLLFHGVRDIFRKPALNPELTERLFAMAHELALDLASLNIQRGRDHGLQHYTAYVYKVCGLSASPNPASFDDLAERIRDPSVREKLRAVYGHPANIDLFVGGILEDVLPGSRIGPTFACIIADQFKRLRAGDRLWYEAPGVFTTSQLAELRQAGSSLSRVICANGDNITEAPLDSFRRPKTIQDLVRCAEIPKLNLALWKECPSSGIESYGAFTDTGRQTETETVTRVRRHVNPVHKYSQCSGRALEVPNRLEEEMEERIKLTERQNHVDRDNLV